jgi:hypothetical protein
MVGAVAAMSFPLVKELEPRSAVFEAYSGEHWRIVAGKVMNEAFRIGDIVASACFGLAFVTLIVGLLTRLTASGALGVVRYGGFAVLAGVTFYALFFLRPEMRGHVEAYWAAAEAGEMATATQHQEAFADLHGAASMTMATQVVLLVVCIALTTLAPTTARVCADAGMTAPADAARSDAPTVGAGVMSGARDGDMA